jgi:hypothetical protein
MHQTFQAQFELQDDQVLATVIERDTLGQVFEGEGDSVFDAVAAALHIARLRFASEHDERDACVAAMRAKRFHFRLNDDGTLTSLGFA